MATRDRTGRQIVRSVRSITASRETFLQWMDDNAGGEAKLAEALKSCRDSLDPRVKVQAVKLEAQIRGYLQPEEQGNRPVSIHFHLNQPSVRDPAAEALEADVVDVKPSEDDDE